MSARDRWRRLTAFARASKREADAWVKAHALCPFLPGSPDAYEAASRFRRDAVAEFRAHTAHAWARLPEHVRAQVQP